VKRMLWIVLLLVPAVFAQKSDPSQVRYVSGSAPDIKPDALGHVDLSSEQSLVFASSQGKLVIPYTAIRTFEYRQEVTHHLGVLPAIAVGLLKARQHQHFFSISYQDDGGGSQAVVLEVPKHMAVPLEMMLRSKAPQGCRAPACVLHY